MEEKKIHFLQTKGFVEKFNVELQSTFERVRMTLYFQANIRFIEEEKTPKKQTPKSNTQTLWNDDDDDVINKII